MAIDNNHVVALNYILHTIEENGEKVFVEQTTSENPLTFLYGVGMMIPTFEENIKGLTAGDKNLSQLLRLKLTERKILMQSLSYLWICSKNRVCHQ